jgi:nucleotide-binding universal stress UspA family protein
MGGAAFAALPLLRNRCERLTSRVQPLRPFPGLSPRPGVTEAAAFERLLGCSRSQRRGARSARAVTGASPLPVRAYVSLLEPYPGIPLEHRVIVTSWGVVMKRILVAVDGSEPSLKAARMAADVALRFGSKLTLVHVVPKLLLPPDVYGLTLAEVEKEHRAYADRLLENAVASLEEPGLEISTSVLYGSPAEAIAEEAAASDVGMLVVGSRGHGAVARMFLGSVSDRIIHISPKPVLVVH